MPKLTKEQARELAKSLKQSAFLLGQLRLEKWKELRAPRRKRLEKIERDLFEKSEQLITREAGIILDDLDTVVEEIKQGTAKANKVIGRLEDINQAINVGTAIIALATGILSKDASAVMKSLKKIKEVIKEEPAT